MIKKYTRFGPVEGKVVKENELDFDEDRKKMFIINTDSGKRYCLIKYKRYLDCSASIGS